MIDTDLSILEFAHRYRTCGLDPTINNRRIWIRAGRVGAVRTPPALVNASTPSSGVVA
ncbi:hypothetical protein [Nocardia fusca]|uniref:hypothetical protein n=1 Tax=Nocardia fusca TaxID=941183 RepID=UPI000AF4F3DD|nr:hypothetical protein [Nocardia fusca]